MPQKLSEWASCKYNDLFYVLYPTVKPSKISLVILVWLFNFRFGFFSAESQNIFANFDYEISQDFAGF